MNLSPLFGPPTGKAYKWRTMFAVQLGIPHLTTGKAEDSQLVMKYFNRKYFVSRERELLPFIHNIASISKIFRVDHVWLELKENN